MKIQFLAEGILSVVLDDEKNHNALSLAQALELQAAVKKHQSQIRLLVFENKGRIFCSGGHLKDYAKLKNKTEGIKIHRQIRRVLQELARQDFLKIALVSGDCYGGGIELLSTCDLVWAEPQVFFGLWQSKNALSPGWGGFARLKERVSSPRLKQWLLLADVKSAGALCDWGLVDQVVPDVQKKFEHEKSKLLKLDSQVVQGILKNVEKDEAKLFESLWWSEAHRQTLKSWRRD